MKVILLTQLAPGVRLAGGSVLGPNGEARCQLETAVARALATAEGDVLDALSPIATFSRVLAILEELRRAAVVCRTLQAAGRVLARALPIGADFPLSEPPMDPHAAYRLSRFAYMRRVGDRLVLESPRSHAQIQLEGDTLLPGIAALAAGAGAGVLAQRLGGAELAAALAGLLAAAGMLEDEAESSAELRGWAFHDLLLHSRSRAGRHSLPYGEPYGALPTPGTECEAWDRPHPAEGVLPLWRPPADAGSPPLDAVLATRRSRRHHAEPALTCKELAEFLYRSVRGTRIEPAAGGRSRRPYPGAGGAYELEVYVGVNRCQDLDAGLYHYDPLPHLLERASGPSEELRQLLQSAGDAAQAAVPQTLLLLTARFARLTARYGSIAYALILKDVGTLMQTMYLVATAMGLAACAVGGGNADLFARAAGLEYYSEGPVGEFMLGRPAEEVATPS